MLTTSLREACRAAEIHNESPVCWILTAWESEIANLLVFYLFCKGNKLRLIGEETLKKRNFCAKNTLNNCAIGEKVVILQPLTRNQILMVDVGTHILIINPHTFIQKL